MDLINLGLIFLVIIIVMRFKKPLYVSIAAGILITVILYKIPLGKFAVLAKGIGILLNYFFTENVGKKR